MFVKVMLFFIIMVKNSIL